MSVTHVGEKERELFEELSIKLQELRENAGVSQNTVASAAGCSKDHISEVERGQARLKISELLAYCRQLHVTPNDLLGYEHENKLTSAELILLMKFRRLDDTKQQAIIEMIRE